jgi:hypothetical protein
VIVGCPYDIVTVQPEPPLRLSLMPLISRRAPTIPCNASGSPLRSIPRARASTEAAHDISGFSRPRKQQGHRYRSRP